MCGCHCIYSTVSQASFGLKEIYYRSSHVNVYKDQLWSGSNIYCKICNMWVRRVACRFPLVANIKNPWCKVSFIPLKPRINWNSSTWLNKLLLEPKFNANVCVAVSKNSQTVSIERFEKFLPEALLKCCLMEMIFKQGQLEMILKQGQLVFGLRHSSPTKIIGYIFF